MPSPSTEPAPPAGVSPRIESPPEASGARRARAVLVRLGPDFGLLALFLLTLAILVAAYGASFVWAEGPILVAGGIGLGLIGVGFVYRLPAIARGEPGALAAFGASARRIARDWGPFLGLMWAFESMETYTGVIRTTCIDDTLYRMDLWLFGAEPTVWAGRFHHPLLTDWMAFTYGLYFILPMILATALSVRGRREDFREMSSAVVIQLGVGFLLFLFFPAGPPRYYAPFLGGQFHPPRLFSHFGIYELQQGAFDTADPVRTRSAFPSLHCSLALLTLIYAWRFGGGVFPRWPRLYFWICLPLVVSLWLSTVYLRHHWVPDILAGFALGFTANLIAPWLRAHWPRAGGSAAPTPAVMRWMKFR